MNFLAHLHLAGDDEGLTLGAMLGDFLRGDTDSMPVPASVRRGILLHRHIDQFLDTLQEISQLREAFDPPFRRYSGIIIDLAFDHHLALRWKEFSSVRLRQFDRNVRALLARHKFLLPRGLTSFMRYADRRGLFAAYRSEDEILFSLHGIGRRLTRPNPLHRVEEIWPDVKPLTGRAFGPVFSQVRRSVLEWCEAQPVDANLAGLDRVG